MNIPTRPRAFAPDHWDEIRADLAKVLGVDVTAKDTDNHGRWINVRGGSDGSRA